MEYRDEKRGLFWSDAAANPLKAIEFALNKIEDPFSRTDFLIEWQEGDVCAWPEFFAFVADAPEVAIVPREPTEAMLSAMWSLRASNGGDGSRACYAALLDAAKVA